MARVDEKPAILMVGPTPPPIGGIATQVQLLLASSLAQDFRIEHLNPSIPQGQGAPRRLLSSLALLARFVRLLRRTRAPLVHLHSSSFAGFYEKAMLGVLAKVMGRRAVLHLHGGGLQRFWDGSRTKWLIAWLLQRQDTVIVLSAGWQAAVAAMSPHARTAIVPTSVPTARYVPPLEKQPDVVKVAFVGWMDRNKGVFDLVEAMAILAPEHPELQVHMIGHGRDFDAVKQQVAQAHLDHAIHLHGWVEESVKVDALRGADIFVLPSHVEGLPTAVLEAMAAGLPVVATTVGAIPEVIAEGKEGLLVPPQAPGELAAALVRLCADATLRAKCGAAALRKATQEYDIERSAERIRQVYRQLLHQ